MPYVPDTPKGGDTRRSTQPIIQQNFQAISDFMDVNHTGFDSTTPGLHSLITFTQQATDPITASGQMALYAKKIDDAQKTGLFARYPSNGKVVQIDGSVVDDGSGGQVFDPAGSFQGWQYLSGGILMKWGYSAPLKQAFGTLVYPYPVIDPIPEFRTTPFHIEMMPLQGPGAQVFIQTVNNLTYSVLISGSSVTPVQFVWMALGT